MRSPRPSRTKVDRQRLPSRRVAQAGSAAPFSCWPRSPYANSLRGPFVFDDLLSVVENLSIRDLSRIGDVLRSERELPTAGRPLVNLSFALNYAVGGLSVTGYHLVNLAFHRCALVIFGIVRRTLELPAAQSRLTGDRRALRHGAPGALHPLNTEAVDYVTQRSELMMALCYLLTLYASLRAWQALTSGTASRWSAVAIATCAAGMACKESMATAPLMVALYDRIFLFDSFAQALQARRRLYLGLSLSWIVLAFVIWSGPRMHSAGFSTGVSPWTYLLNQAVMIVGYLRLAFWPRGLVANYGWPVPISSVMPPVRARRRQAGRDRAVCLAAEVRGFLGAWFFVTLAPTSSIVPIATESAQSAACLPLIAVLGRLCGHGPAASRRPWRPDRGDSRSGIRRRSRGGTVAEPRLSVGSGRPERRSEISLQRRASRPGESLPRAIAVGWPRHASAAGRRGRTTPRRRAAEGRSGRCGDHGARGLSPRAADAPRGRIGTSTAGPGTVP